jgi:hypothetical protein
MTNTISSFAWKIKLAEALQIQAEREAEREAEAALSNPEFEALYSDDELRAQSTRLLERIAAYERERQPIRTAVAGGVAIVKKAIDAVDGWLEVNRAGLERLRRVYTPAVLDAEAERSLEAAIQEAGLTVVPVALVVRDREVRLAMRWRQDIPRQPPSVTVQVSGQARSLSVVEWMDWNADAASTQSVRLGVDLTEIEAAALRANHDAPVLNCQWSAATGTLHLDLLPKREADDDG